VSELTTIVAVPHALLDARAFVTQLPAPLGELPSAPSLLAWFGAQPAPLQVTAEVQAAIRDLLRHSGFKPRGRNKPASEYLIKAVEEGWMSPAQGINVAVDACNAVSLHSGLPVSVVDLGKTRGALRLAPCGPDDAYVFNPAGQIIEVGGLISLHDADGPFAGPVKDAQRTKTDEHTTHTLSLLWGTRALPGRVDVALAWYVELVESVGGQVAPVVVRETAGEAA